MYLTSIGAALYHLTLFIGCIVTCVGLAYTLAPGRNPRPYDPSAVMGGGLVGGIGLFVVIEAVLGLAKWA